MPTKHYPRYSAEQWQAWIEEQAASGLSQLVFCEQNRLSKSSLQLWKRRLGLTRSAGPASSRAASAVSSIFAPVMACDEAPEHEAGGWEIELDPAIQQSLLSTMEDLLVPPPPEPGREASSAMPWRKTDKVPSQHFEGVLLTTCRLNGVGPYTYLVDVLQHIAIHPASRAASATSGDCV